MGYRLAVSIDIPLNSERFPIDLTDIRMNSPLEGEKKIIKTDFLVLISIYMGYRLAISVDIPFNNERFIGFLEFFLI